MRFLIPLTFVLLCGCGSEWYVDTATPPRAWTTHPLTKNFKEIHASYVFLGKDVDAYVKIPFLPFHYVERGRSGPEMGEPGDWVTDITFHGITERYWGHFVPPGGGPDSRAIITVVPAEYIPA